MQQMTRRSFLTAATAALAGGRGGWSSTTRGPSYLGRVIEVTRTIDALSARLARIVLRCS